jgi:hypothetical protein
MQPLSDTYFESHVMATDITLRRPFCPIPIPEKFQLKTNCTLPLRCYISDGNPSIPLDFPPSDTGYYPTNQVHSTLEVVHASTSSFPPARKTYFETSKSQDQHLGRSDVHMHLKTGNRDYFSLISKNL